ncbi:MAG TPA: hypothetical protein VJ746_19815 [Nitrospira sp.]|nr:hypothetical protein [Nitrospira sp.]
MYGIVTIGFLLALPLTLVSCATITDGSTQEVSFQSSPEGVRVTLIKRVRDSSADNVFKDERLDLGQTPFVIPLDRAENQMIEFSKDGYKKVSMKLTTMLNGWFWGNLVLGGPFGSTTDSTSGAMYEYSPSQYFVTLNPEAPLTVETAALKSQRDKAKEFIIRRFNYLITDLSKGGGEDLRATFGLLKVNADQEADAQRKMRALSEVYPDAAVFADRLTELYLK